MEMKCYNRKISYVIDVPEKVKTSFTSIKKIKKGMNQNTDLVYKLNGLYAFLSEENVKTYLEPFAGIGFSSAMIKELHDPIMILNDINIDLVHCLERFFPNQRIYNRDVLTQRLLKRGGTTIDCCFFDHNRFTFTKQIKMVLSFLQMLSATTQCFIWTDVFPFSLKKWDIDRLNDYLNVAESFINLMGWGIESVYLYPNKHVMLVKAKKGKFDRVFIDCKDKFTIKILEGFGL